MKKISLFLFAALFTTISVTAQSESSYSLIPKPTSLEKLDGHFNIGTHIKINAPEDFRKEADLFKKKFLFGAEDESENSSGSVHFIIDHQKEQTLGAEGYHLKVTPQNIKIVAAHKEGAIHGMFSLIQLQQIQKNQSFIPAVNIIDTPRFSYRGMHLDVSRHFFPVSFLKKYIDMLALYKFNTFHWHLTDAQGWRLEIKKYPKLTQIAAWRSNGHKLNWHLGEEQFLHEGDPNAYGGYYTQKEAREVVAYAAKRGITVIPEIEFPAHSEEVLDVYPELGCSGERDGTSEFCVCKDATYTFMKNVLKEVMDIFPSRYIHIGGDEAPMDSWKDCKDCQALMKRKGFTKVEQLQSYAIKRLNKFLVSHERKLIGWDEILKGGLPKGATVMSWRGVSGGIAAAEQGHDAIMTPGGYCYFDHYQSDPNTQPKAIGGYIPLWKVYSYNPVPESLNKSQAKHILGVQANLWTEYIPTTDHVEYMVFPRMLALAEVGWTAQNERKFKDFHRRLQSQYLLLQRHHINYYRPSYRLHVKAVPDYKNKRFKISFRSEQYNPTIYYTLDGTTPDTSDYKYSNPFYTEGQTTIKAAIFKDGERKKVATYNADYHKAIGKKVRYLNGGWSSSYPAQKAKTLTNGITGSLTYQDKQWQGFLHDMDVVIDMGAETTLHQLSMRFMQLIGPGVYIPDAVSVYLSKDGENYHQFKKIQNDVSPQDDRLLFKNFKFNLNGERARYIRVKVKKQNGFMFSDEIKVN
ncbi:MAG TPA: family 20 glycosylhydrolase [Chitinophagaceae bacterium]|nr:family 20 glycosylhydrolase [Chitinophagaceae bacterium]